MLPDRTKEAGMPALKRIRPVGPGLHRDGVYRELFFLGTGQSPASWSLPRDFLRGGTVMEQIWEMTPVKRKRLLKTFGGPPAGYTNDDLERFLDLLYGLFSDVYTMAELRRMRVSDPFDRSDHPRQFRLVELTDWLEALVA
jgi:hypothetical protein